MNGTLTLSSPSASLAPLEASTHVTCLLGSFDPVHRGHLWLMRRALESSDAVVALIPERHFNKRVRPGRNASFAQRLNLLRELPNDVTSRASFGQTDVVLFIELLSELARRLPGAHVRFAMGDDSFRKVLGSADYYARMGRPFGPTERSVLDRLRTETMVVARHGKGAGYVRVPAKLADISSTRVRQLALALHTADAPRAEWLRRLAPLVTVAVAEALHEQRLYRCGPAAERPATAPATRRP